MESLERPFRPEVRNCKLCLSTYKLNIPYAEANRPARDLCDDCLMSISQDEFMTLAMDDSENI